MKLLDAILPKRSLPEALFGYDPFAGVTQFSVGGNTYTVPVQTTMPGQKAEAIGNNFEGYVLGGLQGNGVIFGLASVRLRVFSQVRFQFQNLGGGRPGDLFGGPDLALLERPWPGGTTSDLLAVMILHADFAGNSYLATHAGQMVPMRPDWVEIVLGERRYTDTAGLAGTLGMEKLGYVYYHGGKASGVPPVAFLADEVVHFAPQPDPLAWYRGMSWLTPVIREIQADGAATGHKLAFFENAATPNLAVSLKEITDPDQFEKFVEKMDEAHKGWTNAYKTLYLGAGADVTVIGADMRELDFKNTQGAGETRLAQAAGVPPVVASLSEGVNGGSSLNAGNFGQARRQFADMTLSHLWGNVSGSLEVLVPAPQTTARLWYDARDVPFLREDAKDDAEIRTAEALTIKTLVDTGFDPDAVVALMPSYWNGLKGKHSGLYSVQLQEPGATKPAEQPALPAANGNGAKQPA